MKTIPFEGELTEDQQNNIKAWVAELRSGKYEQGRKVLFDRKSNSYCCLGVACEINQIPKSDLGNFVFGILGYNELPCAKWFLDKYGFAVDRIVVGYHTKRHTLFHLNDIGYSFNDIASIIEACFLSKKEIEVEDLES